MASLTRKGLVVFVGMLALALLQQVRVLAVPAAPFVQTITQPDGTQFQARLRGDEWFHWTETVGGNPVERNAQTGYWVYAVPPAPNAAGGNAAPTAPSNSVVGRQIAPVAPWQPTQPPSAIAMRASSYREAVVPPSGTGNIPVILVNFSDRTPIKTPAQFDTMLFGSGKSMKNLYTEMSRGTFTVSPGPGGVVGWYNAPNTHDYYGVNTGVNGQDAKAGQLVAEAVAAAEAAGFNFAPYDQDNDGYVDVVNIVHQGTGEEVGGSPSTDIWSHRWTLNSAKFYGDGPGEVAVDGKKVNDYIIQPELFFGTTMMTVGVFAHEYGHALGLPDLYDINGGGQGLGVWSLMAGGSWNGVSLQGDTPAHMDAWCKMRLGWLTPTVVTSNIFGASIPQVEGNNASYKLPIAGAPATEYYLIENRQKVGFDVPLPGSGLLIYHVDDAINTSNQNQWYPGRTTFGHYRVALEQADGFFDLDQGFDQGDAGDPFPGSTTKRTFDQSTTPSSSPYSGAATQVAVRNISNSAGFMTADLIVNALWSANSVAVGSDNQSRLLWTKPTGEISLWTVNTAGSIVNQTNFGPYPDWSAIDIAVGTDNQTRVLWQHSNGQVGLWTVNASGGLVSSYTFGPYTGWTAVAIAVGGDNKARVLWQATTGQFALWTVDAAGGTSSFLYGPYAGWSVTDIAAGSDNVSHIVLQKGDGQVGLWRVNTTGAVASYAYGPYAGWSAVGVTVATDNTSRLLLKNSNGQMGLWIANAAFAVSSFQYGPLAGWSAVDIGAGLNAADTRNRVLWQNSSGQIALWILDGSGALNSSYAYGPF